MSNLETKKNTTETTYQGERYELAKLMIETNDELKKISSSVGGAEKLAQIIYDPDMDHDESFFMGVMTQAIEGKDIKTIVSKEASHFFKDRLGDSLKKLSLSEDQQNLIKKAKEELRSYTKEQVTEKIKELQRTIQSKLDDLKDETNKTPQPETETQTPSSSIETSPHIDSIYENLIGPKPSKESFSAAYTGYSRIIKTHDISNKQYLTIVDYTKGRSDKRLYVIDLKNNKTLFHEQSGHGKNSGGEMAHAFSNHASSNKSSLGFMKVGNKFEKNSKGTREGLRLYGLEDGINDQTDERGIFIHPASVTGSLGCITLPKNAEKIMKTIQGGIIFSYDDDSDYLTSSPYLNDPTTQAA